MQLIDCVIQTGTQAGDLLVAMDLQSQDTNNSLYIATSDVPQPITADYTSPFNHYRMLGGYNIVRRSCRNPFFLTPIPSSHKGTMLLGNQNLHADMPVFVIYMYGQVGNQTTYFLDHQH